MEDLMENLGGNSVTRSRGRTVQQKINTEDPYQHLQHRGAYKHYLARNVRISEASFDSSESHWTDPVRCRKFRLLLGDVCITSKARLLYVAQFALDESAVRLIRANNCKIKAWNRYRHDEIRFRSAPQISAKCGDLLALAELRFGNPPVNPCAAVHRRSCSHHAHSLTRAMPIFGHGD